MVSNMQIQVILTILFTTISLLTAIYFGIFNLLQTSCLSQRPVCYGFVIYNNETDLICHGLTTDGKHLVTTAHCVQGNSIEELRIINALEFENPNIPITHVDAKYVHPDFHEATLSNDIAILKLSSAMDLDELDCNPLDCSNIAKANENPTLKGLVPNFYYTPPRKADLMSIMPISYNGNCPDNPSDGVVKKYIKLIDAEECRDILNTTSNSSIYCGSSYSGPYRGDSGSPLWYYGRLVGLLTKASAECQGKIYSIYANLSEYSNWFEHYNISLV